MASKIINIEAKETLDSRGNPTVEVELETNKGVFTASVPSGASTGKNEALELRDENGKGVSKAISNVNEIIGPKIIGKNPENQKDIDDLMIKLDGTENKSNLGANAVLPVSIAVCRAGAEARKLSLYKHIADLFDTKFAVSGFHLPNPCFNIIEGGAHAENDLDIQEFMIIPQGRYFRENLRIGSDIFQNLKDILEKNYGAEESLVGDEGGFAPKVSKTEQALYLLKNAIEKHPDTKIGLDSAASGFFKEGKYYLDGQVFSKSELLNFYEDLADKFPIIFIEDPYQEEDWEGFKEITKKFSGKIHILGDDLTTTNLKRIKEAHNKNACSGVIIKPNQIGTVSEAVEAAKLAKSFGWKIMVSHRSGETLDDFIADLSVGIGADFIKSGAPTKKERLVKYEKLLKIEEEIIKNKK